MYTLVFVGAVLYLWYNGYQIVIACREYEREERFLDRLQHCQTQDDLDRWYSDYLITADK